MRLAKRAKFPAGDEDEALRRRPTTEPRPRAIRQGHRGLRLATKVSLPGHRRGSPRDAPTATPRHRGCE